MAEVTEVNYPERGRMAEGEGGRGRLIKIIIIAVVVLLLLGGGVLGAMWFLTSDRSPMAGGGGDGAAPPGRDICPTDQLAYLDLGSFVVNLADGRRYLKTTIQIMMCDEEVSEIRSYLETRQAEVKDLVISELQTLSTEQLRDQRQRELLRQRLLSRIESILPNRDTGWESSTPIEKVLITEFYLQ